MGRIHQDNQNQTVQIKIKEKAKMKKRKLSFVALICVLVMLFSTVSVNAEELAYGEVIFDNWLIVTEEDLRVPILSNNARAIHSECYFEVAASGSYTYVEYYMDGQMTGYVNPEPPDSVRIYEPDSDHFHQGYLTSYYIAPDYDNRSPKQVINSREYYYTYPCEIIFYGSLECLCW